MPEKTIESLLPLLDKEGLERIQTQIKSELDIKSQVVYFIEAQGTGKVKIGKTNDIQKRLSGLQTSCPTN